MNPHLTSTTEPTLEAVMEGINAIAVTMDKHGKALASLSDIYTMLERFADKILELKSETTELRRENADLKKALNTLTERVNSYTEVTPSTSKCPDLDKLTAASNANNAYMQRTASRQSSSSSSSPAEVVLSGFPEGVYLSHHRPLALTLFKKLGINTAESDILSTRLMIKQTSVPDAPASKHLNTDLVYSDTSARCGRDKKRVSIAVTCNSPSTVHAVIAAKKKFGSLQLSQLGLPSIDSSPSINGESPSSFNINVNELLPTKEYKLLHLARTTLKPVYVNFVWASNGSIFAQKDRDSLIHTIQSKQDVVKLKQLYSTRS